MNAKELYQSIQDSKYGINNTTLCHLHKPQRKGEPCIITHNCGNPQTTPLMDFDSVKEAFHNNASSQMPSSVDAITCNENALIFIEIKGSKIFLERHKPLKKDEIEKQLKKYDFSKKYVDSQKIIKAISNVSDNDYNALSKWYIVVSDLQKGENQLVEMLNYLADNDTQKYNKEMKDKVKELENQGLKSHYIEFCQDFDKTITKMK